MKKYTKIVSVAISLVFIIYVSIFISDTMASNKQLQDTLAKYDCYSEWVSGCNQYTGNRYRMYNAMLNNACYTIICEYTDSGLVIKEVCDTE